METDVKIVIEGEDLLSLVEELLQWEAIRAEWYDHIGETKWDDWERSPIKSDARRQSIVYGNCLETIKATLGRRELNQLMAQMRDEKAQRRLSSDPTKVGGFQAEEIL